MKSRHIIWSCIVAGIAIAAAGSAAELPDLEGQCIGVESCDTLIVQIADGNVRVRPAGVSSPVEGQLFAERSRVAVVESTYLRQVRVVPASIEPDGTLVADVTVGELNLAERQLENGLAWSDPEDTNHPRYAELEAEARESGLGLWSQSTPASPWEFVRRRELARSASMPTPTPSLAELAGKTQIGNRHITLVGSPSPTPTPDGVLTKEELAEALVNLLTGTADAGSPEDTTGKEDQDAP